MKLLKMSWLLKNKSRGEILVDYDSSKQFILPLQKSFDIERMMENKTVEKKM